MELNEYKVMYNVEDNYWLYVGMRELVFSFIKKINSGDKSIDILDAGCGTGKLLDKCNNYNNYGIDFSEEAIKYCQLRKLDNIVRGSISKIPFKDSSFNIVTSIDVLYHKSVEDDERSLKEIYRVMKKDGMLLLNLPAYNFLRSKHDEAVHTRYRYNRKVLKIKVEKAGFEIRNITYRNSLLFPIAVIKRITDKIFPINTEKVESDLKTLPYLVNKIFTYLLSIENKLIMLGVSFPFGLSIYCVARKKN